MNYLTKKRTPKRPLVPSTKQPDFERRWSKILKAFKNQGLSKAIYSFQREYSTRDFRD